MKIPVLFIAINVILVLGLTLVQVVVSNSLSTNGIELGDMQEKIDIYKKKNAILQEQVLTASSFTTIASEAATMGFEEVKQAMNINQPLPLAIR